MRGYGAVFIESGERNRVHPGLQSINEIAFYDDCRCSCGNFLLMERKRRATQCNLRSSSLRKPGFFMISVISAVGKRGFLDKSTTTGRLHKGRKEPQVDFETARSLQTNALNTKRTDVSANELRICITKSIAWYSM